LPFPASHPALLRALTERGYAEPTQVQAAVLNVEAEGRDLLVSALTGSGKTVALGLVLARELLGETPTFERVPAPLALVVAPTRELALQVHRELEWLYAFTGARVASCVGGMDPARERRALAQGAHIVVGTPGRLRDHLERGALDLGDIKAVVLDEADEMLDLGFREELETLLKATPPDRRTLMFSATVPAGIQELAGSYQVDALRVSTDAEAEAHPDIEYRAVLVAPAEREHAVVNILRFLDPGSALVFCMTREGVSHLQANLQERGFRCVALSGELSQAERNRALQALRDGHAQVCVATDVAARGLDLRDLGVVIHADIPRDAATLMHRSGRTGRAGRKGVAVLIVPFFRRRIAERLCYDAGVEPFWSPPPTAEAVRALDHDRLVAKLKELTAEVAEEDRAVAKSLLETGEAEAYVGALVARLRATMPSPEEIVSSVERPRPRETPPPRPVSHRRDAEPVWFRLNAGRAQNADPRWIVPLLCRRGRITKQDIGKILIYERETCFAIHASVAYEFGESACRPDRADPHLRIHPVR
jgi:ATP-dependent RNA helicase DeaD